MGLFSIKKPKQREEPQKDTYYIEPTEEEPKEESWFESEQNK